VVCEKLNVSRQTYYRWRAEDKLFADNADMALSQGEERIHDIAESNVLRGLQQNSESYTKFWLTHRNDKYKKDITRRRKDEKAIFNISKYLEDAKKWFVSE
ncbi:hypothetical protein HXX01_04545, partial [Candidatus Nomurabacteria bacterium]|nr:hypothetical protein [Candidatus Nomurabacteria bacterium]